MVGVIEMRIYRLKPGKRAEFLDIFLSKSVPAHDKIGMSIVGPFPAIDDPDAFFFMRGFPDLASRDTMKSAFYDGELWKTELEQILMPMIDRYEAVLIEDPQGRFAG
jgi:NIPSNAP